ncbi:MAG TPA: DUF4175 family protein [Caulobacteraceae bacterium]|nr:DUF4175 family protein [Caulobacteraceae bacterium]
MSASLDPKARARLTRALWLARAVMLWEQGAGVGAPLLLAFGAIGVAGLWGLFELTPRVVHGGLITVLLLTAAVLAVRAGMRIRWPSREEVRLRLEADSRLIHAPLTVLEDAPAVGDPALWALHKAQAAEALKAARLAKPKAGLAAADPFAARYALALAAILGLWANFERADERVVLAYAPAHDFAVAGGRTVNTAAVRTGLAIKAAGAQLARLWAPEPVVTHKPPLIPAKAGTQTIARDQRS